MTASANLARFTDASAARHGALSEACAVVIERHFSAEQCAAWAAGVHAGRADWTEAFGGEQFSLGRAFYTHFEEEKSAAYFDDPPSSDARVEAHCPGLQQAMRDLVASLVGGRVVQRRGWCGPGVHVFPPGAPVAARGGVHHFDTEGLAAHHVRARRPAISVIAMLQTPATDGGLRVWNVLYDGHEHPTRAELRASSAVVTYGVGDVVMIDSYRLHQIQPFDGSRARISATVHAAELGGLWECWF